MAQSDVQTQRSSATSSSSSSSFPEIVELNVGGQTYVTRHTTLTAVPNSLLWTMFSQRSPGDLARDSKGRFFLDRDGVLFRYILEYLRDLDLVLPEFFKERSRLQKEAEFFKLHDLSRRLLLRPPPTHTSSSSGLMSKDNSLSLADQDALLDPEEAALAGALSRASITSTTTTPTTAAVMTASSSPSPARSPSSFSSSSAQQQPGKSGYITVGYRGSYTIGRDIQTDAKFRRVARITVCSKTSLAKEVFGDTLNESRDPDRPPERYTSRYYLKYNFLEQAFDRLAEVGFRMVACSSTGTCAYTSNDPNEDKIWTSYTEYVFSRE